MAINMNDPRLQRELQRNRSKRSMGAGRGTLRSSAGKIIGRHAGYQEGVKQRFRGLAQQKKSSDIAYGLNKARLAHSGRMLGLQEDTLKSQQKMMPYHIGGKLLTAAGAGYEGYRRKLKLREENETKERRHQEILDAMRAGGGSTSEGSLMGLRARRLF